MVYVFISQNVHDVEYYDGHGFDDKSKMRKRLLNAILDCFLFLTQDSNGVDIRINI